MIQIHSHSSLSTLNTFKLPVIADALVEIKSIQELLEAFQHSIWKTENKFFLGGGSNILFAKETFPGLVVNVKIPGIEKLKESEQHVWIKAGAGVNWHTFIQHCISQGYSGIENLSYIPGTVGAAPIQNIGAYGIELKDVLEELEAFHIETGQFVTFKNHDCEFGYRSSIFKHRLKNQYMICSVTLKLNKFESFHIDYGEIQNTLKQLDIEQLNTQKISQVITYIRQNKLPDPEKLPNVGSFFKNPFISTQHFNHLQTQHSTLPHYPINAEEVKVPAGWLIEKAGWKGKKIGHVGTYEKQSLVIVNHDGKATGQQIAEFSQVIQHEVRQMFDIELIPEVTIIE